MTDFDAEGRPLLPPPPLRGCCNQAAFCTCTDPLCVACWGTRNHRPGNEKRRLPLRAVADVDEATRLRPGMMLTWTLTLACGHAKRVRLLPSERFPRHARCAGCRDQVVEGASPRRLAEEDGFPDDARDESEEN